MPKRFVSGFSDGVYTHFSLVFVKLYVLTASTSDVIVRIFIAQPTSFESKVSPQNNTKWFCHGLQLPRTYILGEIRPSKIHGKVGRGTWFLLHEIVKHNEPTPENQENFKLIPTICPQRQRRL